MSQHRATIGGTIGGMARRANPAFAGGIVAVSVVALGYAVTVGSLQQHTFVHVMAGLLWTGTDLFMGAILGPVIGGLTDEQSAAVFERLTPKTAFFLPSMALVTIAGGITLAQRLGVFPHAEPWLALFTAANLIPTLLLLGRRLNAWRDRRWQVVFAVATVGSLAWVATTIGDFQMTTPAIVVALAVVTVLSVQGFGFLMPGEIRMYFEMTSDDPDPGVISAIGKQNAMLGGVQGAFQLVLIADMVYLRYGGF
ncbi:hypothetical protein BN996_00261 [Haloferax massiliensis]|uniref:Uncharacterized protein n=2 Tax=Haloferacaceae TaxID=1644056 RepID=A0A0D6JMK1_9EURY|nr:hypothetical protein [Haloferax massiliensis]MDS0242927.1 hypothetical protein [Haloferax sp. S2CR25]MDS0446048.1 hypothetical protein [Haloferax sp. S2CR25-2]CQR48813.1 hypothetical protein BN996_00261 [Haloferax massiliensis]